MGSSNHAAIFNSNNCFSAGMCVRDDRDKFICAQTMWTVGKPSPQEAEAWGLKQALMRLMNFWLLQTSRGRHGGDTKS
jgi:hypothetical protein